MIDRRKFLRGAGASAGVAASSLLIPGCSPGTRNGIPDGLVWRSPPLTPFVDALPQLSVATNPSLLLAKGAIHRFHRDLPACATFAYGAETVLGPTIEATRDAALNLEVVNQLGHHPLAEAIDLTVNGATSADRDHPRLSHHLHGGVTPPQSDGHPMDTFHHGESKVYQYGNRQEAAHLWYHDHSMGITRLNVYAGLAGNYLLRDQFDTGTSSNPLGLPSGEFELPLTLSDRGFNADGSLRIRLVTFVPEGDWEGGMIGDVATVNGKAWPVAEVARGWYRFRIVNASNLTTYRLRLSSGQPLFIIGSDLGLLNAPQQTTRVQVAAGERVDVLVDFSSASSGDEILLLNDAELPGQATIFGARVIPQIMKFRVSGRAGMAMSLPSVLRGGASRPTLIGAIPPATKKRRITINQNWDAARSSPAFMTLNNVDFEFSEIETPRTGTTEIWEFINTSLDDHPMHLHLAKFRVVERRPYLGFLYQILFPRGFRNQKWNPDPTLFQTGVAQGPLVHESGWKDTVWCHAGHITRVAVQFPTEAELGFNPDAVYASMMGESLQGYVFHCHVLDHEDNEMMLPYRTVS